jgi:hypothetical protein
MGFCLTASSTNRWPKSVVPYQIDANTYPVGSAARQQVLLAINAWNTTGIVKLLAATATDTNIINITSSGIPGACSSPIGLQGGTQIVGCIPNAGAGVIMHEIGHALGLIHEHKRPDRNNFITVNAANIKAGFIGQFTPVDNTDCPVGTYDCGSIMHYGPTSFSVDGVQPTITVTNPAVCTNIGQRNALSAGDVAAARVMYDSVAGLNKFPVLSDSSDNGPALAFHDNALFLAWRGSGNDNLNVMVSDDRGGSFHGKHTSLETSADAPALASHNGRLFIAWKGSGNDNISVAVVNRSSSGSRDIASISNKLVVPGNNTTDKSPAIASHNGNLYPAFKGSGNDNLNVMVSTDNGASFPEARKHISGETSSDSPTLVSCGSSLYIAWKGSGNENISVATVDVGTDPANPQITGFSNKVVIPGETTQSRPTLAQQKGLLFLSWRGAGNDNFNIMFPGDHSGCSQKFITPETSSNAPALASDADTMWVAWRGSGNDNLTVALVEFASQGADSTAQGLTAMNDDLFNELVQIQATLANSFQNLSQGLSASLTQEHFTNVALAQKIAQETTMICQLEQISKQTCDLLSEVHVQTGLKGEIARNVERLLDITRTAHPGAELELQRLERLRLEIERCCPPEVPPSICVHVPCPQPPEFHDQPPPVDYKPIPPPPPPQQVET